ncbi:RING finger protein 223 [Corythoichthys intestinalis]|uniref:RING finger protein 223 n=1 Tax=Corythoichthys intestinalis TaxID=161448 RepID=UPI0025A65C93|nr:RING finger protein 223 [Corythoichthys intestinalis]XP_061802252.1 RING finger protein 223 [Nerophis lumbriciformis]
MEPSLQFWHTQTDPQGQESAGERQKKMSTVSQLECPICYNTYDNVFKTPKKLECGHTFCLECLSRLMAISPTEQEGSDQGTTQLLCPFCRHSTTLPDGGPPSLPTNHDMLHKLPGHQQQEEPVWLDGEKLCYKSNRPASDSLSVLCICIDIGADKRDGAQPPTPPQSLGPLSRLADWKRIMLFVVIMVLLVIVVLWPLQCVFTTGNMRCMQMVQQNRTAATVTTLARLNIINRPVGLTD